MGKSKFIKELESTPPIVRKKYEDRVGQKKPIVLFNLTDAKIQIARINWQLQVDTIDITKAKALLHSINVFIFAYRECEMELLLAEL